MIFGFRVLAVFFGIVFIMDAISGKPTGTTTADVAAMLACINAASILEIRHGK